MIVVTVKRKSGEGQGTCFGAADDAGSEGCFSVLVSTEFIRVDAIVFVEVGEEVGVEEILMVFDPTLCVGTKHNNLPEKRYKYYQKIKIDIIEKFDMQIV